MKPTCNAVLLTVNKIFVDEFSVVAFCADRASHNEPAGWIRRLNYAPNGLRLAATDSNDGL